MGYCQNLVQFIWRVAQPAGGATLEYGVAITLITDPKSNLACWRDAAIEEALAGEKPQQTQI